MIRIRDCHLSSVCFYRPARHQVHPERKWSSFYWCSIQWQPRPRQSLQDPSGRARTGRRSRHGVCLRTRTGGRNHRYTRKTSSFQSHWWKNDVDFDGCLSCLRPPGVASEFIVNTCNAGSGALSVTIDGPSKVKMDCQDCPEGYKVSYTPMAPGNYLISIKYGGPQHIVGSPFKAKVSGSGPLSLLAFFCDYCSQCLNWAGTHWYRVPWSLLSLELRGRAQTGKNRSRPYQTTVHTLPSGR